MRRLTALFILLTCLTAASLSPARAGTLSFGAAEFPSDAEEIDLKDEIVTDMGAFEAFLKGFPDLRRVDMFSTPVDKKQIARLTGAFPEITFGWTISIANGKHLIRTDQTAFSTLHGECVRHTSEDMDVLRYCTALKALDLGHNSLTDVSFLEPLKELRVLILADNRNISGLEVLEGLEHLEYLELFTCSLRDISFLSGLTELKDLNLANNGIRNYDALYSLTKLRRLWIADMGANIGAQRMKELQAVMPDAVIMTSGHPTANGWRTDSHYDTIWEIFHTNEYIPFPDAESAE